MEFVGIYQWPGFIAAHDDLINEIKGALRGIMPILVIICSRESVEELAFAQLCIAMSLHQSSLHEIGKKTFVVVLKLFLSPGGL